MVVSTGTETVVTAALEFANKDGGDQLTFVAMPGCMAALTPTVMWSPGH